MVTKLQKNFKIYLHLKSFYYYYLGRDLLQLLYLFKKYRVMAPDSVVVYLPVSIKKFSVVKSPFVSKLSKEQFEVRVHKVLVIFTLNNFFFFNYFCDKSLINYNYTYYKIRYLYTTL